jgi:hypothetical protein
LFATSQFRRVRVEEVNVCGHVITAFNGSVPGQTRKYFDVKLILSFYDILSLALVSRAGLSVPYDYVPNT